jgi:hypothetical protein
MVAEDLPALAVSAPDNRPLPERLYGIGGCMEITANRAVW